MTDLELITIYFLVNWFFIGLHLLLEDMYKETAASKIVGIILVSTFGVFIYFIVNFAKALGRSK